MENKNNKNNVNNLECYKNLLEFCLEFTANAGNLDLSKSAKRRLKAELKRYAKFEVCDETVEWAADKLIDTVWEYPEWGDAWDDEILNPFETKDKTIYYGNIVINELVFLPHNTKRKISLKSYKNFKDFVIDFTCKHNTLDLNENAKSELRNCLQYVIENYNRENNEDIKLSNETVENAIDIIISTVWDNAGEGEWEVNVPLPSIDYYAKFKIEIDDLIAISK